VKTSILVFFLLLYSIGRVVGVVLRQVLRTTIGHVATGCERLRQVVTGLAPDNS
jgi:hypothetical protein